MKNQVRFKGAGGLPLLILFLWYVPVHLSAAAPEEIIGEERLLIEVLAEVEETYQVFFNFEDKLVRNKKVDFELKAGESLEYAVDRLLSKTNLKYALLGEKYIVIYQNDKSGARKAKKIGRKIEQINKLEERGGFRLMRNYRDPADRALNIMETVIEQPIERTLSGTVHDEEGLSLIGATVMVKGTQIGTVTDVDGNFSMTVPDDATTLVFSYTGYTPLEVEIGDRTVFDITMYESVSMLDEVVVVGYGTQKKANMTGAVDEIGGELIESRQSPTVSQLLQGTSPGLSFDVGNFGFQPGAELDIQVRGAGSINGGGGAPYVLIDGIPGDMNRLNPEDIASISILKDAAASAIYGARAPFGVILITTKSGALEGKVQATYSGSVAVATPQNLPSMLNSYLHARAINEAGTAKPGGGGRYFTNEIVDNIVAFQEGNYDLIRSRPNFPQDATFFETTPRGGGNAWGFNQFGNANRDWFDEYYGSALNQKHNLSFQGGGKTTSYYVSAGYFGQEGVLNYGTDAFRRLNVLAKIKTSIADWWDFTYQPRFSQTFREQPNMDNQGSYDLIFHQIARTMPTNAKYDGFGNIMIQSKIPWVRDAGTDIFETDESWQNFVTELRPLKGWTIYADFAYRTTDYLRSDRELTVYDTQVDQTTVISGNTFPSHIEQTHFSNNYWTTNMYTSYEFSIKEQHNFRLMAGTQFEKARDRSLSALRNNLLVAAVPSLETASGEPTTAENLLTWATEGYFGRFNYNYKGKYLLEGNFRYDGSSRFLEGKRWGFFPSVSAGWNVHNESFWASIEPVINTFKFRGSWGELGNHTGAGFFVGLPLIPLSSNAVNWIFGSGESRPVGFAGTPGLISPDVTWETIRTVNFGVNMSFLKNRLQADFDFFERTTFDMIGPVVSQPGVLGATLPRTNNAELRSRGWELALRWRQSFSNGLTYNVGFNLFDSQAEVTKYLNETGTLSDWYEGRKLGEIWGYTANDLYRTQEEVDQYTSEVNLTDITGLTWNTGDVKYEDINGDGAVNDGENTLGNPGDLSIIGNSTARFQYGLNLGLTYKGLDLSMLWRGVGKRDLWFNSGQNIFWGFRTGNQSSLFPHHLDYFRDQPGDEYTGVELGDANFNLDGYYPRPYINNNQNNKNRLTSTRYLQNGAYLRLQNVQLGYNLPQAFTSKLRLQKVRFYLSGENLLTFSELTVGIDPLAVSSAWGVGKTYGADRIFSFGLSVTY